MSTKIEWTDETWSPVTGCTKVSEGCRNCYAERMAKRLAGRYGYPADGMYCITCMEYHEGEECPTCLGRLIPRSSFDVTLQPDRLDQPLRWKKPRMVFIPSMGDLFHKDVPFEFVDTVFDIMARADRHTFQLLTKRPERMLAFTQEWDYGDWLLPNVWFGVSVENQEMADERIPLLLQTPAAVRFVSCEPLLGPVELGYECLECGEYYRFSEISNAEGECRDGVGCSGSERWRGVDWVIVGGETGPGARPMDPDWARDIRDQCQEAGVPFFFKQMSGRQTIPDDLRIREMPLDNLGGSVVE